MTVLLKIKPSQPHFCCSGEIEGRIWPLCFKSASETVNAARSKRLYRAVTASSTGAYPRTLSWTLSNPSTKLWQFCTLANVLPNNTVDNTAPEPRHRAPRAEETRVHRQPRVQFSLGAASGKQSPGGAGHGRGSLRRGVPLPSRRGGHRRLLLGRRGREGGPAPAGAPRAGLPAPAAPCRFAARWGSVGGRGSPRAPAGSRAARVTAGRAGRHSHK